MRFSRYLAMMASTWVVAAATVAGFTLLVDAIGISPVPVAIAGFNAWKPLRQDYDWIVKRYDVGRKQPATIFMGSSRIKQTIDPGLLAGTKFAPAYNGGLNGSANLAETRAYLLDYLETDKNLHRVFIEVFIPSLFTIRQPQRLLSRANITRPAITKFGIADDIADLTSVFFSMGGLTSAIRTVAANRKHENLPAAASSADDGFVPVALAPHHFSVRNVLNFVIYTEFLRRGERLSQRMVAAAKEMIAHCRSQGVDCRFFLSPLHADVLFAAYHLNLWPELEKMKRALAGLAPTYDFTRYSPLLDERVGPVVYWPEAFHFSPALGELVARAMTDLRTPDMPANFGAILQLENIDANLAAWREERDSWIAQHPHALERIRRAEENFRNGVSFKTVTEAEMAAGGW
jgi:hypothetical protein